MVPGARELYGAWPKVHLSLKMQKSEILNRWWWKKTKDVVYIFDHLCTEIKGNEKEKLINLFKIFTGQKYTDDEVKTGLSHAKQLGLQIQDTRSDYKNEPNPRIIKQKEKFFNEKRNPKLREIYEKREIPLFNARTHGRLEFLNEIISEKDIATRAEFSDDRRIWVFKFKDANGKLSLNFYSEKMHGRRRRNHWR